MTPVQSQGRSAAAGAAAWPAGGWWALAGAGALHPLACTVTGAWAMAPASAAVLVVLLSRAGCAPARAAVAGGVFGTAWLVAAVWWLFISMHRYGGLPAPLAALAVLLLAMALSLYLAAACAAWVRWRSGRIGLDALLFAALWGLAEWARGALFTGFPWAASGYTQVDAPLAALAPWGGVSAMGAAVALAAALLGLGAAPARPAGGRKAQDGASAVAGQGPAVGARRWKPWRRRASAWAAAALVLLGPALLPAPAFTDSAGAQRVSLLQTNVAQDQKFDPQRLPEILDALARGLITSQGDLVVAPETAMPLLPSQLQDVAPGWWEAVAAQLHQRGRVALVGVPLGDAAKGYTNSALAVGPAQAQRYRYDKHHLVPFGEFIPTGFRWFTQMMEIPLGDFDRGPRAAPSFALGSQRLAPNICYEDLFGEELAARFKDARGAPTVLVNMSNIGWFGDTIAVEQHLNISRLRALELQRPMIRATNTGATAIVDHRGRVTYRLPAFTQGVLEGVFEGRTGLTPFARWAARFGLWPVALVALAVALAIACLVRGRAAAPPSAP